MGKVGDTLKNLATFVGSFGNLRRVRPLHGFQNDKCSLLLYNSLKAEKLEGCKYFKPANNVTRGMRRIMMKRIHSIAIYLIIALVTLCGGVRVVAQEYKYEVGAMLGASAYMGDVNRTNPLKRPHPSAGVLVRQNRDFRWAWRGNLAFGRVSGQVGADGNVFPTGIHPDFYRSFAEMEGLLEFNFLNYSDKYGYLNTKPYTPYIFAGLGTTMALGGNSKLMMHIPVGVGFKYKWRERWNVGAEFSIRKLMSDDFDVLGATNPSLSAPYGIQSSALKNKDWYTMLMFTISWDFGIRIDRSCYK